jgi:hypothetical protein
MKTLLTTLLALALLCANGSAGDQLTDWSYGNFEYSATIPGDDNTQATIVGPAFPQGVRVLRDYSTVDEFKLALIRIVDSLNATSEPVMLKRRLKKRR